MNKTALILLSVLTILFLSGCASSGYQMGDRIDNLTEYTIADYSLPDDEIVLIPNQNIVLILENGNSYSGRVIKVDDISENSYDFVLDLSYEIKTFRYSDIESIKIVENPSFSKIVMTSVGIIVDLLIIDIGIIFLYLAVYGN
jgi:hypothetical protein